MGTPDDTTAPYRILDKDSVPEYLASIPAVVDVLGGCENLTILEIGDGNLNYVYRVSSTEDESRSVILKQAVPYLRMAGEGWPLGRDRMLYEIRALQAYNELVPDLVPKIFHSDEAMSTMVMQCLDDHIILRRGMIDGIKYPSVGKDIGYFMAETHFKTSAWFMDSLKRRELMDQFTLNAELCKLTEDFIFTFPYIDHESNYSNPTLDAWAKQNIHTDQQYKTDVLQFKELFVSKTEALLHGDLHSGSLMVNQEDTYIIDMEFAFFGPISFEVGKVIANFLLSYTSHYHRSGGADYQTWLLEQITDIWQAFHQRFIELWQQTAESTFLTSGFLNDDALEALRTQFMVATLQDAAGFAACSMARRTTGIAGVADIRDIEDTEIRAALEIANLKLSKRLMAKRGELNSFNDLLELVKNFHSTNTIL